MYRRRFHKPKYPLWEKILITSVSLGIAGLITVYIFQWSTYFKRYFLLREDFSMLIMVAILGWAILKFLRYLLKMQVRMLSR